MLRNMTYFQGSYYDAIVTVYTLLV